MSITNSSKKTKTASYMSLSTDEMDDVVASPWIRETNSWTVHPRLMIYLIVFSAVIFVMIFVRIFASIQSHSTGKVMLFGDALITRDDSFIGRSIEKNLANSIGGMKVYTSGVSGDRIKDLRNRLSRDIINRRAYGILSIWKLSSPDAVIMYWDSDVIDVTNADDVKVISSYKDNLRDVLQSLKSSVKYVAVGGPTLYGELPRGQNTKDTILDLYTNINRNITTEQGIQYLDTRQIFFDNIPKSWSHHSGYLTTDGEHQNTRGAKLLTELFATTLTNWLKTNPL